MEQHHALGKYHPHRRTGRRRPPPPPRQGGPVTARPESDHLRHRVVRPFAGFQPFDVVFIRGGEGNVTLVRQVVFSPEAVALALREGALQAYPEAVDE